MMAPPCHNWPDEFISDFTNETEYHSLRTLLGSGSLFNPFPRPTGQSVNSLCAVRRCHHSKIYFHIYKWDRILQPAGSFEPGKFINPLPRDVVILRTEYNS